MGITTNNYRRYRIVKGHTGKQLLIPINRNANILAYRGKQNPGPTGLLCDKWNTLIIRRHPAQLRPYLGPLSNNCDYKHRSSNMKT